jgi:hypothetical protein
MAVAKPFGLSIDMLAGAEGRSEEAVFQGLIGILLGVDFGDVEG